jgi:1,4-alpha-glucan branching enzyme
VEKVSDTISTPSGAPAVTTAGLGELDLHLAGEGRHERIYEQLGAHVVEGGVRFAVWAPNARAVSVVGDWNRWDGRVDRLAPSGSSGIWHGVVAKAAEGHKYKFEVDGADGQLRIKADPYARYAEVPPRSASVVYESRYGWGDHEWLAARQEALDRPLSVYEVHLPSWRRSADGQPLGYRELAEQLGAYVTELGFTHVELLPVMHHPFSGSWGYQVTGYYAPLSTLGEPDDFRSFVDHLHSLGIGVILDWVPAHFPRDEYALARFDGTALYEHEDPRRGAHPDWGTLVFNLGRNEVRNFLLANALFWLREFHVDGMRVDAVASMLYLDYSRREGEWVPNAYGGREDLDAIAFLRELNEVVHGREPAVIMAAEESTAWPGVSRPTYVGGLGFGFKWNMGWMHDTLQYFSKEPVHRRHHHHELTFSLVYAWNENFVLPLSHDEVVHGKRSLLAKMPGDQWQRFANLRALYGLMWAHPGKKLLFMGGELAQEHEWSEAHGLDWAALEHPDHAGVQRLLGDLNAAYAAEPALWEVDFSHEGFRWLEPNAANENVLAFARLSSDGARALVCVANLSPVVREAWRVGLPAGGRWREVLNTDSRFYGGSDVGNGLGVEAEPVSWGEQAFSAEVVLPPLAVVWLVPDVNAERSREPSPAQESTNAR